MKLLKYSILGVAVLFVAIAGLLFIVFMALFGNDDDNDHASAQHMIEGDGTPIDDDVKRYKDDFKKYAKENDIGDQVDVLMALTMQESGGSELDVMQSSESQGDSPGTITSPKKSIKVGVEYYADLYEEADEKTKLTLQAYNMGGGFIDYAKKHNDGKYSKDLAQEFSDKQKKKTGMNTYGDPKYVQHVTKYIDSGDKKEFKGGKWGAPLDRDLAVTSGYGKRDDPMGGGSGFHYGIDFECSAPDKVIAVHDGEIYQTGQDSGGWGNHVIIKHSDDELSVVAHLSEIKASKGDNVKKGDQVGVCGATGGATGEHVHLEYWDSEKAGSDRSHRKNPNKMLKDKGDEKDE